jgi:hypothetical protein
MDKSNKIRTNWQDFHREKFRILTGMLLERFARSWVFQYFQSLSSHYKKFQQGPGGLKKLFLANEGKGGKTGEVFSVILM